MLAQTRAPIIVLAARYGAQRVVAQQGVVAGAGGVQQLRTFASEADPKDYGFCMFFTIHCTIK
jgi:hypothetical protein